MAAPDSEDTGRKGVVWPHPTANILPGTRSTPPLRSYFTSKSWISESSVPASSTLPHEENAKETTSPQSTVPVPGSPSTVLLAGLSRVLGALPPPSPTAQSWSLGWSAPGVHSAGVEPHALA